MDPPSKADVSLVLRIDTEAARNKGFSGAAGMIRCLCFACAVPVSSACAPKPPSRKSHTSQAKRHVQKSQPNSILQAPARTALRSLGDKTWKISPTV